MGVLKRSEHPSGYATVLSRKVWGHRIFLYEVQVQVLIAAFVRAHEVRDRNQWRWCARDRGCYWVESLGPVTKMMQIMSWCGPVLVRQLLDISLNLSSELNSGRGLLLDARARVHFSSRGHAYSNPRR